MGDFKIAVEKAEKWTDEPFDEKTRGEVRKLIKEGNRKEIIDRFFGEMEFGTAGLRGMIGTGTTRMNIYTVSRATKGLADCLNQLYPDSKKKGVVVGYDCRHKSQEFARRTAGVLAENGIQVYLFNNMSPTQLVPFAVRKRKAFCGIMITSSHNPAIYNGYKVFWSNGAQIISPVDKEILSFIEKITDYGTVQYLSLDKAKREGGVKELGKGVFEEYIEWAKDSAIRRRMNPDLKVVYTPLHGVGLYFAEEVFKRSGCRNFFVVQEQKEPDANFPTVKAPNPEVEGAMDMAFALAKKVDGDIILATDGDADRVGVAVKDRQGQYLTLTGNQAGVLSAYYMLSRLKEENKLTGREVLISTVVSTPLTGKIAERFGINYKETLTGFKWMGNVAEECVNRGYKFILAFEEAFGITFGESRDKDGIISIALMGEIASYCKTRGITVDEYLDEIYLDCGIHLETQRVKDYPGKEGIDTMQKIMQNLREHPPAEVAGLKVSQVRDILKGKVYEKGKVVDEIKDIPSQNLLTFCFNDKSWVSIRPSGTEPKIKIYAGAIKETRKESLKDDKEKTSERLDKLADGFVKIIRLD